MPKHVPEEIKLRGVALLVELKNAARAAEQLAAESPEYAVTGQTIRTWAKGLSLKLQPGRPAGTPGNTDLRSPHRARILELLAEGKTQAEAARLLGLSPQHVSSLLRRKRK